MLALFLPVDEIANTMDDAKRIGDGKSIGYDVVSSSTAAEDEEETTASSSFFCGDAVSSTTAVCASWEGNGGNPTGPSSSSLDIRNSAVRPMIRGENEDEDEAVDTPFFVTDGRWQEEERTEENASTDDWTRRRTAARSSGVDTMLGAIVSIAPLLSLNKKE